MSRSPASCPHTHLPCQPPFTRAALPLPCPPPLHLTPAPPFHLGLVTHGDFPTSQMAVLGTSGGGQPAPWSPGPEALVDMALWRLLPHRGVFHLTCGRRVPRARLQPSSCPITACLRVGHQPPGHSEDSWLPTAAAPTRPRCTHRGLSSSAASVAHRPPFRLTA